MDEPSRCYRFTILLLVCLAISPNFYFLGQLTALQPAIAKSPNCTDAAAAAASDCCADCLGIGDDNYNFLISLFYCCSIVAVLLGGWLIDRFGNWLIIVFASILPISFTIIAVASSMRESSLMLPLLYIAFMLRGFGYLPLFTARSRIIGLWFTGKELRLAFGIAASVNRLAAIPAFLLTEQLREAIGLQLTLWLCPLLSCIGVVCAICVTVMDVRASSKMKVTQQLQQEQQVVSVCDVARAGAEFWLLAGATSFLVISVFLYLHNAAEFLHDAFDFTKVDAARTAGLLEYCGIVLAPALGFLVDRFGRASQCLTAATLLLMLGLLLLSSTQLPPFIGASLIGFAYSAFGTVGLGSVPQVVSRSILAMATSVIMCGHAGFSFVGLAAVAAVLGHRTDLPKSQMQLRWRHALWVMLAVAVAAVGFAAALSAVSWKRSGPLTAAATAARTDDEFELIEEDGKEKTEMEEEKKPIIINGK